MSVYIMPGLGVTSMMYAFPAYQDIPDTHFIDWPKYQGEKSIPDLAHRIIREYQIDESCIVGGSSLGGMVGAEISKHVKIKKLLLIGSTLEKKNVNGTFALLSHLAFLTPVHFFQIVAGVSNYAINNALIEMFTKTDPRFVKVMSRAIFTWSGNTEPDCAFSHIHGARDRIIYPPEYSYDKIEKGDHIIAMTHSEQVAEFIKSNI